MHKVLFEGRRATGVALESGETYSAGREVVLSAGAIATPKILQLSGIGNAAHLKDHGIDVVADLPGVGENYQDHLEATVQAEVSILSLLGQDKGLMAAKHMLQYMLTKTGLLTSNVVECGGFVDTSGTGSPDVQFHVLANFYRFCGTSAGTGARDFDRAVLSSAAVARNRQAAVGQSKGTGPLQRQFAV